MVIRAGIRRFDLEKIAAWAAPAIVERGRHFF